MSRWIRVCNETDLQPDSGVCALVEGKQIALFYMQKEHAVYAIQNYDPIGKANVLSRGMIGDIKGEPVVASPLYKQHYNLLSGNCLEDNAIRVAVYRARLRDGRVEVELPESEIKLAECAISGMEAKV